MNSENPVRQINTSEVDEKEFLYRYVGCVVLTQDKKIILQQRGADWKNFPGYLAEFGGRVEEDETPMQAVIRELHEELGAVANEAEIVSLGAITEGMTHHNELIYCYFWFDKQGTITGCYEGEAKFFDDVKSVLNQPKMTDGLRWLLSECKKRGLLV